MTNEQQQVKNWMQKFGQETPEKPTIPSLEVRKLRAKLILEEALETIKALGLQVCITSAYASGYLNDIDNMGIFVLDGFEEHLAIEPNLVDIADGCEDLKVVTEGTLIACGLVQPKYKQEVSREWGYDNVLINEDPFFNEVMRSNNSKLWTNSEVAIHKGQQRRQFTGVNNLPLYDKVNEDKWIVKDCTGKVMKSPSYSPANLTLIIEDLSK